MSVKIEYRRVVADYVSAVQTGQRIAGRLERWAVARYLEDLQRAASDRDCEFYFDEAIAASACEFFPLLPHSDGEYAGKPFYLLPWQAFCIWNIFGWQRYDNRCRRFREAFLSLGRGNGKTPFGAAILLYLLAFDCPIEQRAEVYTAAVKRDQASLSFDCAKRFVERSGLSEYVQVLNKAINIPDTNSKLEPLSSDGKSADGRNIHGLLRDELHAWSDYQRPYYDKLQTALGKRRQPLAVTITTAGDETSTIWSEQYSLACRVVDPDSGTREDSLFVFICEMDDDDSEFDENAWHKANPMLEHGIVKVEFLRDMAARAKDDPAALAQFRRYHCNKLTTSTTKAFSHERWRRGAEAVPDSLSPLHAGVDLGWCDDLAAVGYCAPVDWISVEGESRRRYAVFADVFIPRGSRRKLDRPPFLHWIKSGRITVTETEWTDTGPIYAAIRQRQKQYGVKTLAFDPSNCREFAQNVEENIGIKTFPFSQKPAKYNEPLHEFSIALDEGRIIHGGDSLLEWAATNVAIIENSVGHRMPAKDRSSEKIDPFVAVLMAFSECLFAERKRRSIYEERGPIIVGRR